MTKTIPTAAEIRGRLDYIGSQAAQAEAKDAIVAYDRAAHDLAKQIIVGEKRKPLASEDRELKNIDTRRLELTALLAELEPQYKHDMGADGGGARTIDGPVYDGPLDGDLRGKNVATAAAWATKVAADLRSTYGGRKAVVSGSLDAPSVVVDAAPDPQNATRLLELIPTRPIGENNFAYLRQTVRTNNAAPVADAGTKPTSVFTFTEVEDRARVVAHLSEPFPVRYFQDHTQVTQMLRSEMAYGVIAAIEEQVVTGDGTGESFTGLLEVSGTTQVVWGGDVPTTLRNARTELEILGEVPTAFVMNPQDLAELDLLREDGATGQFLDLERVFGPMPRVPSTAVAPGVALLADWRQTRLYVREGSRLDIDASGAELFDKNLMKMRAEQRSNLAVLRPQAVAIVDINPS